MKNKEEKLYTLINWSEASQEKVKQRLVAITAKIEKVLSKNISPNQSEDSHSYSEKENLN